MVTKNELGFFFHTQCHIFKNKVKVFYSFKLHNQTKISGDFTKIQVRKENCELKDYFYNIKIVKLNESKQ